MITAYSLDLDELKSKVKEKKKIYIKSKKYKFLISAKNLYLTYSKCSLELIKILVQLKSKLSYYIVQEYLLVREYDEIGDPYVHVYLKLFKKAIIKRASFLDLQNNLRIYRGNYQSAPKPNKVIEYMVRSILSKNDPSLYYSSGMSNLIGELGNYKTLPEVLLDLAESGEILQAMNFLRKENPSMYLKQGSKIKKRLVEIYHEKHSENQREHNLSEFYT